MLNSKILKLEDANGQIIETTLQDVTRIIADLETEGFSTQDNANNSASIEVKVLDNEGKDVDVTNLLDAIQKDKTKTPIAIDVLIECTHSGENDNSAIYRSDSMEKDAQTFMYPFKKPFLKNHDMYVEPIGRVKDSYFGRSDITDRDAINVEFRVTDQDAMMKFLDGRYRTVSIGGSPKTVTCNICGKALLKDGQFNFCGHWRGNVYNNQKALWTMTDITYNEVSVVNNPADKWAQVKRITLVYQEDDKTQKKVGDNNMSNPITDSGAENLVNQILGDESLATDGAAVNTNTDPVPAQDNNPNPETNTEPLTTDNQLTPEQIADLQKKVSDFETENNNLKGQVTDLQNEKKTLEDSNKELNDKLVTADAESKSAREQSLRLAIKYKEVQVGRVKDLATIVKEEIADEVVSAMSIKDLDAKISDLQTKLPQVHKTPAPVTNPGVVDNNNDPNVVKDNNQETNKVTVKDYVKTETNIIDSMVR